MPPTDRCPHYYALLRLAQPFLGPWLPGVEKSDSYGRTYNVGTHEELLRCPDPCHHAYQVVHGGWRA